MQIEAATRRAQVDEMAEKQRQAVEMLTQAEEKAKSELNSAAVQMSQALADGCVELAERAGQILPDGNLAIIATEERTRLGWNRDGIGVVMRNCLSGSERVIFDAAVAYALLGEGCTAFLDAGECGNDRLEALAPIAARCKCQLVLFRWTDSKTKLPKMNGWKTIELQ
jgi:hypothetical protein